MQSFDFYFLMILALAISMAAWVFRIAKKRFALRWHVNLIGAGWVTMAIVAMGAWWMSASGVMESTVGPDAPVVNFGAPLNATIIAIFWYFISIQLPGFIQLIKNHRP